MKESDGYPLWQDTLNSAGSSQSGASWTHITYLDDVIEHLNRESTLSKNHLSWFIEVSRTVDGLAVFITDFAELWSEKLTFDDFNAKLMALNPNLECDNPRLFLNTVESILLSQSDAGIKIECGPIDDPYLKISYKSSYSGFPFLWEFDGSKCSSSEMKQKLISPLVASIVQYQRREEELLSKLVLHERESDLIRRNNQHSFSPSTWHAEDLRSEAFFNAMSLRNDESLDPFKNKRFKTLYSHVERLLVHNAEMPDESERDKATQNEDMNDSCDQGATAAKSFDQNPVRTNETEKEDDQKADDEQDKIILNSKPAKRRKILRL